MGLPKIDDDICIYSIIHKSTHLILSRGGPELMIQGGGGTLGSGKLLYDTSTQIGNFRGK